MWKKYLQCTQHKMYCIICPNATKIASWNTGFRNPHEKDTPLIAEGVYPQSDRSLAIVDINVSKGFVDLWVHLTFVIFAIFNVKRQLKLLEMASDQVQTCLIFPLRWAGFPIKIGRNAQWEHLFSKKWSLSGNTIYLRLFAMKGSNAIRTEYNCFFSMIISVDTLCGFAPWQT